MTVTTTPWDITDHLQSAEQIAAYLEAVFDDGDAAEIRAALGHVARAAGMTGLARKTGISRAGLYKALGEGGNPSFETVAAVLKALGVKMKLAA
jgi:probable addiction module antidote protein